MPIAFKIPSGLAAHVRTTSDSFQFSLAPLSWRDLLRANGWVIRGTTLKRTGLRGLRVPIDDHTVVLTGSPGGKTSIRIGPTELLSVYPSVSPTSAWTPGHIEWLARTIAGLLHRPLERVAYSENDWQVWLADPRVRGRLALAEQLRLSKANHAGVFGYALEEPPGDVGLDSALYRVGQRAPSTLVRLTRHEVLLKHWTVPYAAIDGVEAVWSGRNAMLLLASSEHIYTVMTLERAQILDLVHLQWLAHDLERRARMVRPKDGDDTLVPDELRRLTRHQKV